MSLYYISIALVVAANVFYHISQKYIPAKVNPMATLVVTYATALIVSIIILSISSIANKSNPLTHFKNINWASFLLGFAIVGLEVGFLLAYRAGWNISSAALIANVIVALLLIPVGLVFFKEYMTLKNILGVVLSMAGIVLISIK